MANELQYYANPDADSGQSISAKVYDDAGVQVGATVTCTEVGTLAIYHGDMPASAAGVYTVRFFASSVFVAQGSIEWDGTREITGVLLIEQLEQAESYADTHYAAIISDIATKPVTPVTDLTGIARTTDFDGIAKTTDIDAIDVDLTGIARTTDFDGIAKTTDVAVSESAITQAIANLNDVTTAEIEAALLDENDGSQILNAIVGAIGNQNIDEVALVSLIRADIERTNGKLDSLNNTDVSDLPTIAQLNTQLTAIQDELELHIDEKQGLTNTQMDMLIFLRDLSEADELYTADRAKKFIKGTDTVLIDKDVTSNTVVDVTTAILERVSP